MAAQWRKLLAIACDLIDQVNAERLIIDDWSLGGGTAMMLRIDHRDSRDIDIFLSDPQLLAYLDPSRRNFRFEVDPAHYTTDGAGFLKLAFRDMGEVDFIIGQALTDAPTSFKTIEGHPLQLETLAEVVAKKIFYRGSRIAPRDIFDLAAASTSNRPAIVAALAEFRPQVEKTLEKIELSDPLFVTDIIMQLELRPMFRPLAGDAFGMAKDILRETLARSTPAS